MIFYSIYKVAGNKRFDDDFAYLFLGFSVALEAKQNTILDFFYLKEIKFHSSLNLSFPQLGC